MRSLRLKSGSFVLGLVLASVLAGCAAHSLPNGQTSKAARITERDLAVLIENAKTPADHQQLAVYYEQEALDFEAKASKHRRIAAGYRRPPLTAKIPTFPWAADHCDKIAADAEHAAKEARIMAEYHSALARGEEPQSLITDRQPPATTLDLLVARMNAAKGDARVEAMVAVINALVQSRIIVQDDSVQMKSKGAVK